MKICHLTSAHPANDVRIFEKECVSLANAGFEVYLVANGKKNHIEKGVNIIAVQQKKQGRLYRMNCFSKQVVKKALELNADVYHLHDPELLRFAKKIKQAGKIVIYDAHEDLPLQISSKNWIPALIRKQVSKIAKFYLKKTNANLNSILTATKNIKDSFSYFYKNTIVIANYPILNEVDKTSFVSEKKEKNICYIGGICKIRGLWNMLDALTKVDAILDLAGNFSEINTETKAESHEAWNKVNYHGQVDRTSVYQIMDRANAGLVLLLPQPNYLDSLPVKMFEYMAAGIPVIASDFPLWKNIITENHCGICVNPTDIDAIAEAINTILDNPEKAKKMGENGRKAVIEKFNWQVEERKLVDLYKNISNNE